jgi:hypothetical protein
MNRLSLKNNNRLKFKTTRKSPIVLEEFVKEYTPIRKLNEGWMSTCNQLDLQTLGCQQKPMIMPKNLPDHCMAGGPS